MSRWSGTTRRSARSRRSSSASSAVNTSDMPVSGQDASLPLLAAQRQQWVSHHDEPANPRYNCGGYFRLTGQLDRNTLAAAVTAAYSETEALRVVFHERD